MFHWLELAKAVDIGRGWQFGFIILILLLLTTVVAGSAVGTPLLPFSKTFSRMDIKVTPIIEPVEPQRVAVIGNASRRSIGTCRPDSMPYLGITYLVVTDASRAYYGLESARGVVVTAVAPSSPGASAGLRANDMIMSFNGQELTPDISLVSILMHHRIGDRVNLAISRQGTDKEVEVILGRIPER